MKIENFFSSNADIQFHFHKSMDMAQLFQFICEDQREAIGATTVEEYIKNWHDIIDTIGDIAGSKIAPNAKKIEKEHFKIDKGQVELPPTLSENLKYMHEFGFAGMSVNPEYGGLGGPYLIDMICAEILNRACPSTMLNASWFGTIAHIIDLFGNDALKQEFIPPMAEGQYSGCMAMTEPDAGSDLSAIKSYGIKQEDGTWRLHGTKRFITNGTSQICLVLAMNEKGASGLNNLSLFVCPRIIDNQENVKILKLEEKCALKGSATAELAFDGSKAWLLGKEGEGFRYMLTLMNDARIGVGFQGIGLMEATYRLAKDYAMERKTWGKAIIQHELVAEKILDMEVELLATRSLGYKAVFKSSLITAAERYLRKNKVEPIKKAEIELLISRSRASLRRYTPLLKYWVGERSVNHARSALQVFGGYGFTTEYTPEWWVRESLIYSIYEGTSQIQALTVLKDIIKELVRNPRKFFETSMKAQFKSLSDADPLRRKFYKLRQVRIKAVISVLLKLIKTNAVSSYEKADSKDMFNLIKKMSSDLLQFKNLRPALVHAERITEIYCYEELMHCLLKDARKDPSRRKYAERFIYKALPLANALKTMIEHDEPVIESFLQELDKM